MTALTDYQTLRASKYANITSFINDPEPENDLPNLIARVSAIEDWIAEQLLL